MLMDNSVFLMAGLFATGCLFSWTVQLIFQAKNRKAVFLLCLTHSSWLLAFILIYNRGTYLDADTLWFTLSNTTSLLNGVFVFLIYNSLINDNRKLTNNTRFLIVFSLSAALIHTYLLRFDISIPNIILYYLIGLAQVYFIIISIIGTLKEKNVDLIPERLIFRKIYLLGLACALLVGFSPFLINFLIDWPIITGAEQRVPNMTNRSGFQFDLWQLVLIFCGVFAPILGNTKLGRQAFDNWEQPAKPSHDERPSPQESKDLERLLELIEMERFYIRPGLSISVLAEEAGIPEHRVRALINKNLGFRNFNAFLNHYRMRDAKALLSDPANLSMPILTIALDLGFGSAMSFNRIFKAEMGVTPTEFRTQHLGAVAA